MRYQPTIAISTSNPDSFSGLHAGQWIKTENGQRGQFLGITRRGSIVIHWRVSSLPVQNRQVKAMRKFAKNNGSK